MSDISGISQKQNVTLVTVRPNMSYDTSCSFANVRFISLASIPLELLFPLKSRQDSNREASCGILLELKGL